jgi:hypothetical protein
MMRAAHDSPACVVLDIDGVLADVRHRLHFVARRPKNWEAFFAAAERDVLLVAGADFARTAAKTHTLVYLTGRPERIRAATLAWLRKHQLPEGRLLMRADGDRRPAAILKRQRLLALRAEFDVELVVDDDPVVVETATKAGFAVRLADWMPRDSHVLADAQEREGQT